MSVRVLRTFAAVLGTALAGSVLTALPSSAATADTGTVTTDGLRVRKLPTKASTALGTFDNGDVIPIECKLRGSSVGGNDTWYLLPPTLNEFVSARYVHVSGTVRVCGTSKRYTGKTTAKLTKRVAPTTAAGSAGTLAKGKTVKIICKIDGQSVGGNKRWYYLTDGRWVAARYVSNVGAAPGFCN